MMNLIAWSDASNAIAPIVILVLATIAGYRLFKMNKLSQGLLILSSVGAILCVIEGANLMGGGNQNRSVAGAILIAAGLGVMVSIGLALRNTEDQ
ncbi:hypothetical protein V2O64_12600 [Verrucomicrobiaceae bacterium 227]